MRSDISPLLSTSSSSNSSSYGTTGSFTFIAENDSIPPSRSIPSLEPEAKDPNHVNIGINSGSEIALPAHLAKPRLIRTDSSYLRNLTPHCPEDCTPSRIGLLAFSIFSAAPTAIFAVSTFGSFKGITFSMLATGAAHMSTAAWTGGVMFALDSCYMNVVVNRAYFPLLKDDIATILYDKEAARWFKVTKIIGYGTPSIGAGLAAATIAFESAKLMPTLEWRIAAGSIFAIASAGPLLATRFVGANRNFGRIWNLIRRGFGLLENDPQSNFMQALKNCVQDNRNNNGGDIQETIKIIMDEVNDEDEYRALSSKEKDKVLATRVFMRLRENGLLENNYPESSSLCKKMGKFLLLSSCLASAFSAHLTFSQKCADGTQEFENFAGFRLLTRNHTVFNIWANAAGALSFLLYILSIWDLPHLAYDSIANRVKNRWKAAFGTLFGLISGAGGAVLAFSVSKNPNNIFGIPSPEEQPVLAWLYFAVMLLGAGAVNTNSFLTRICRQPDMRNPGPDDVVFMAEKYKPTLTQLEELGFHTARISPLSLFKNPFAKHDSQRNRLLQQTPTINAGTGTVEDSQAVEALEEEKEEASPRRFRCFRLSSFCSIQ